MQASYIKPLLPLRDIVIFPSMVVPLFVGREKSIKALQEVMKSDKSIVLVTQKNSEIDDPQEKDIYSYGCLSKILQLIKLLFSTIFVISICALRKTFPNCSLEGGRQIEATGHLKA